MTSFSDETRMLVWLAFPFVQSEKGNVFSFLFRLRGRLFISTLTSHCRVNFNTNDSLTLFWYFVSLFVFWKAETEYRGWRKEKRRRQQTPPNHALPLATNANVSFSDRCEAWRTGVKTRRGKEVLAEMSFTNSTELNGLDYFKGLQTGPLSEQPREDFLLLPLYVSGFQTDKRLIFSYYFYYEHSILPIIFKKKKKKIFSHCCSS